MASEHRLRDQANRPLTQAHPPARNAAFGSAPDHAGPGRAPRSL